MQMYQNANRVLANEYSGVRVGGFEPPRRLASRFRVYRVFHFRHTRTSLGTEGAGFEPAKPQRALSDYKSDALSLSATPPYLFEAYYEIEKTTRKKLKREKQKTSEAHQPLSAQAEGRGLRSLAHETYSQVLALLLRIPIHQPLSLS